MKQIIPFLFFIIFLAVLPGILSSENGNILKDYELPDSERIEWNSFKDEWMKSRYYYCLKKFNLRMSCNGCVYIYIKGNITIDNSGRITRFNETVSNICGKKISPSLKKCFIEPLTEKHLPPVLNEKEFETMLGTGLKC